MRRPRRIAALAVVLALGAAACSGGSSSTADTVPGPGADLELVESPAPTSPPIDLGTRDPDSVFVGEGLDFGTADPVTEAALAGYEADPLVDAAVARSAVSTSSGEPLASVTVLVLAPASFGDESAVEAYVSALAGGTGLARRLDLGNVDGFAGSSVTGSVVAFRLDDLAVVVEGETPAATSNVASRIARAALDGQPPAPEPSTPLRPTDQFSVFEVAVPGFAFEAFVAEDPDSGFESLPGPTIEGIGGFPEGRIVVVGNEIRAVAWSLPLSLDAYSEAEQVIEPMRALAEQRSGGPVTSEVVAGRTVFSGDADEAIRIFREGSLVLVVDGQSATDADAFVAGWIDALDG